MAVHRAEHCYIGTGCIGLAHIVVGHTGWQAAGSIVVDYTLVVVAAPRPGVVAETTVAAVHIVLVVVAVVVVAVVAAPTAVGSVHYS